MEKGNERKQKKKEGRNIQKSYFSRAVVYSRISGVGREMSSTPSTSEAMASMSFWEKESRKKKEEEEREMRVD